MNIFVTGGTGFLGYHTIKRLLRSGYRVYALSRQQHSILSNLKSESLSIIHGSLDQIDQLPVIPIDICLHFAWEGVNRIGVNDFDIQRKNVDNTLNLVRFIGRCQCKMLIDSGSRQEYAPVDGMVTEDSICLPPSEYGKWKLEAYHQTLASIEIIKYVHLRIFSTYGFGDHPWSLINTCIDSFLEGNPVSLGRCRHFWSFLYIDDFTDAIVSIISNINYINANTVYNLASGFIQPLQYFVGTIHSLTMSDSLLLYGDRQETEESTRSLIPDISKINREIGWYEKVSFPQGIKEIIEQKQSGN